MCGTYSSLGGGGRKNERGSSGPKMKTSVHLWTTSKVSNTCWNSRGGYVCFPLRDVEYNRLFQKKCGVMFGNESTNFHCVESYHKHSSSLVERNGENEHPQGEVWRQKRLWFTLHWIKHRWYFLKLLHQLRERTPLQNQTENQNWNQILNEIWSQIWDRICDQILNLIWNQSCIQIWNFEWKDSKGKSGIFFNTNKQNISL